MATNSPPEDKLKGLTCPMCLEHFKTATLLSCGHSFCKACLEAYDEQHNHCDHIVCPVCRRTTRLDEGRIAGLVPNFLGKDLEDVLSADDRVKDHSREFCKVHTYVFLDVFCQACKEFICLRCYSEKHHGHKIKKKEELEREHKRMMDDFQEKGKKTKEYLQRCRSNAEQQMAILSRHLASLETDVHAAFTKIMAILQENETRLIEKIKGIRKVLEEPLQTSVARCNNVLDKLEESLEILAHCEIKDPDEMAAVREGCTELEGVLNGVHEEESLAGIPEIKFRPAKGKLLALGTIDEGNKSAGMKGKEENVTNGSDNREDERQIPLHNAQLMNSDGEVKIFHKSLERNRKGKRPGATQRVYHELKQQNLAQNQMAIVREREFKLNEGRLFGLAALSHDSVVLGFAMDSPGCDRFSVSGEEEEHFGSDVGEVYDLAFLSDGKAVITRHGDELFVYDSQMKRTTGRSYKCDESKGYVRVCADHHDNIYATNMTPKIYIFSGTNPRPKKVIPTHNLYVKQISVTKRGVMIVSTGDFPPGTITVFDQNGRRGSSIDVSSNKEYLYAAVDAHDRVLVANVANGSNEIHLTRYTLQGLRLVKQVKFQPVYFSWPILTSMFLSSLFYMVSLTPRMIAVATRHHLYFIKLGS